MHESPSQSFALPPRSPARWAFPGLLFGNLLLAFGPWLVRLADVGPVSSSFWRMTLAIPFLLLLTRATRQPIGRMAGSLWLLMALAGLLFAADLAAWHAGILHTRLANATLFGNASSFLFGIYGLVAARTLPGRNQTIAMLLAALGVVMLLGRSYELSPENLGGDALCLLAGVFYAGYLVAIDRARGQLKPWPTLALATTLGVVPLAVLAQAMGETFWPHDWRPLILLALGSQIAGQGLITLALGELPAVVIGLCLLVQPVVTASIGWIVYGERLGPADFAGAAAIAVAIVLVRRPDRVRAVAA